jgi:hypothetical protein
VLCVPKGRMPPRHRLYFPALIAAHNTADEVLCSSSKV